MTTPQPPVGVASPRPIGRLGPFFASIWLFFLVDPVLAGVHQHDEQGWAGVATTVAFGVIYMSVWLRARARGHHPMAGLFQPTLVESSLYMASLVGLGALMMVLLGEPGIAATVYVAVGAVMSYRFKVAAPIVIGIAVATLFLGLVPGWGSQFGTAFAVMASSVAVFGIRGMIARNVDLVQAQAVNAELAVENERTRFARDLHDILGHSLTVITVKAELARRLFDADPERARAELNDLERLSRDALADVRRAVEGYRELTLPGELSRARTALVAAEIEPHLPNTTDEVPTELRELFAWTVREGVTNVLRHSGADRCEVVLSATGVEVRDNGVGCTAGAAADNARGASSGAGLAGLRERAAAVGAVVVTRRLDPGWSLSVTRTRQPVEPVPGSTPEAQPRPARPTPAVP